MAYTAYTKSGTYWTLRKQGDWYRVGRRRSGTYEEVELYGWYRRAGAAATAVGALTYRDALRETLESVGDDIQARLDGMGKSIPTPDRRGTETAPVSNDVEDEAEE